MSQGGSNSPLCCHAIVVTSVPVALFRCTSYHRNVLETAEHVVISKVTLKYLLLLHLLNEIFDLTNGSKTPSRRVVCRRGHRSGLKWHSGRRMGPHSSRMLSGPRRSSFTASMNQNDALASDKNLQISRYSVSTGPQT